MEHRANRLCIVLLRDRAPSSPDEDTWLELYGEPAALLPAARDFSSVLDEISRDYKMTDIPAHPIPPTPLQTAYELTRRF